MALARTFLVRNYLILTRHGFRAKCGTTMYRVIVIAFCFSIVFAGLLLLVGQLDFFTGYQLIYRTPPD